MWQIERLSDHRVERAGEVLARSFLTDPLAAYMLPFEQDRRRLLPWHFATLARYGVMFGEAYTNSGDPRGVAVWLPPGKTVMTEDRIVAAGMHDAPAVLGELPWARFMSVMAHVGEFHSADMPVDHWYLALVGVDPDVKRKGLGSDLLRPVLDKADAGGTPCYLETAEFANRAFYERHGFDLLREITEPRSGARCWTFRRDPVDVEHRKRP